MLGLKELTEGATKFKTRNTNLKGAAQFRSNKSGVVRALGQNRKYGALRSAQAMTKRSHEKCPHRRHRVNLEHIMSSWMNELCQLEPGDFYCRVTEKRWYKRAVTCPIKEDEYSRESCVSLIWSLHSQR